MKLNLWTAFLSVILTCFGQADAPSVRLYPSPSAEVEEGSTLRLHCSYDGSSTPDYINWYLNDDTTGLVIDANSCKFEILQKPYETDRYNISCNGTQFYLYIANISKNKDDGVTWGCDFKVMNKQPTEKASTRINVTYAGLADPKKGQIDEPNAVVTVVVVVGVIAIIAVAGFIIYRKRRNDHRKTKIKTEDPENPVKNPDEEQVKDDDEDHEQLGSRLKLRPESN